MLRSFSLDKAGRPVIIIGLGIQDLDDMKDGPLNLDIGRAIAEAGEQIPSAYPLSPIGDLRIVLMTGRNEDELKTMIGAG